MNTQPFLSSLPQLVGAKVFVREIAVLAEIGLYPHEYGRRQPLKVDVELDVVPSGSEQVGDIINYETIVTCAQEVAASGHIKLAETFAERLAMACMHDARVLAARVRVEKPEALAPAVAGVEVTLRRV